MKNVPLAFLGFMLSLHAAAAVVGPASGLVDGVLPANVLEVNPAGIGQINLVPYYSVRSGFDTYLNLVNTDTRNGKAIKVRLRSADDGSRVGDLTVLLAPRDRWAAALTRDAATGLPRLAHNDRSCTLPSDVKTTLGTTLFFFYVPSPVEARSQAGSVEIITMADIPPLDSSGQASALFAAVTPATGASGASCAASALAPLASDSTSYADARGKGLEVPTSGLMTHWTLINVPRAVSYSGLATAVEARVAAGGQPGYGNIVLFPQTELRVSEQGRPVRTASYTSNPRNIGGLGVNPDNSTGGEAPVSGGGGYIESELPDLSTPYLQSGLASGLPPGAAPRLQAFAISKALASTALTGEFVTDPGILAQTDWVVTMPTRYLSVLPGGTSLMMSMFSPSYTNLTLDLDNSPLGMGTRNHFQTGANIGYWDLGGKLCITASRAQDNSVFASQEGLSLTVQTGTNSAIPMELCGHTTVLRFIGTVAGDGVLGEVNNRLPLQTPATTGWGRIRTPGVAGMGLPIIGFAVSELYNSAVTPGIAGVFGQVFPLSTTKPAP